MRVLIDTNVLLDVLMGRQPYFDISDSILKLCSDKKIEGYIAVGFALRGYHLWWIP